MNIGVIFGGRSVEHDVSIVSAQIVMEGFKALPQYTVIPIYIKPNGQWLVYNKIPSIKDLKKAKDSKEVWKLVLNCEQGKMILEKDGLFKKRKIIDVAFPVIHGTNCEDGTLQGLLEMVNVPYMGCGVSASAMGMDKAHMKQIFKSAGLPIVEYVVFLRKDFQENPDAVLRIIESKIPYSVFVKPANLGSSIGITKAVDRESLKNAIEVAACYDRKIIAERGIENAVEINCAVLGNNEPIASVLEQPVSYKQFLTFEEKYIQKGGTMKGIKNKVKIPAPITDDKTKEIKELAVKAYKSLDCAGISRVDFLIEDGSMVFVNEINTIPGSLQRHLWKASGIGLAKLLEKLIEFALQKHEEKQKNLTFYKSELI